MQRSEHTRLPLVPRGGSHRLAIGALALFSGLHFSRPLPADDPPPAKLIFEDNFEGGAKKWRPTDPAAWKTSPIGKSQVYSQFAASKYNPPHRSPLNFSLVDGVSVGDFVLEVKAQSTTRDYDHRDLCLIFGYQDPAHFYYVHFGKQTDDRANQIFIVNNSPRAKISTSTTKGTPWTDGWHRLKLVRSVADGGIVAYFDDMEKPAMTATDKTFVSGQVGLGSFDDTGNWDDFKLTGVASH